MIYNYEKYFKFIKKNLQKKDIPSNKKILITGCSGFIGQYLVNCLTDIFKEKGNIIYGIDQIKLKKNSKNFKFYKKNLYKLKKKNIPNKKFDYIIHLAGIPSPEFYKKFPLETTYLNAELYKELLEISKKRKSKIIYFSSSEIYGNPSNKFIPTFETYNGNVSSISNRSCYDESKRMGETYSYIFKEYFNVNVKIIRPFNFYGEGMRQNDSRIIPKFFSQVINNQPITVFSNGNQTRTYCHIYDAIVMIIKIIFKGKKFVYNIGNPTVEVSALNLAYKIKKIFSNKKCTIKKIPYPANYPSNEPNRRCPSISNFKSEFNFKPSINLNKGLGYFKEYAEIKFKKF